LSNGESQRTRNHEFSNEAGIVVFNVKNFLPPKSGLPGAQRLNKAVKRCAENYPPGKTSDAAYWY
jgi:hypothetical protein